MKTYEGDEISNVQTRTCTEGHWIQTRTILANWNIGIPDMHALHVCSEQALLNSDFHVCKMRVVVLTLRVVVRRHETMSRLVRHTWMSVYPFTLFPTIIWKLSGSSDGSLVLDYLNFLLHLVCLPLEGPSILPVTLKSMAAAAAAVHQFPARFVKPCTLPEFSQGFH